MKRHAAWGAAPLAVMVVIGAALGGCSRDAADPPQQGTAQQGYAQESPDRVVSPGELAKAPPASGAAAEDEDPRRDPQWVMVQAGQALFTWHPVTDANRGAATERAAEYLAPELVHATPSIQPGQQWQQWREEGAVINAQARVLSEEHPPDTDTMVWRVVEVVQSKATGSGMQRVEPSTTVWMACEKQPDGTWKVKDYRLM